ncbi:hypothetical protein [Avibacterium sp. 21-599]|uniref:hypothetical protein n=1 Tax=Avibacterium sp. 21-599 TaxID=2911528 RepID=UPI00224653E6|nr:hypothetical protein [Avibacterium sp. 21-599]MCW9716836.1 hypothetical protein [Avibacterium sp. 21-599]
MKMTGFAKFVDKTENIINKFKHWQVAKWVKVIVALSILSMLFSLFYVVYKIPQLIILFLLVMGICYSIFIVESPEVYHLRKLREEVTCLRNELKRYK